jgi:hypothetical protein
MEWYIYDAQLCRLSSLSPSSASTTTSQPTIFNQQLFNLPAMAPNVTKKYKAAAVNAEPGWLDLELSVEKTINWINEAGKNGCKLVAFPELWIPGR